MLPCPGEVDRSRRRFEGRGGTFGTSILGLEGLGRGDREGRGGTTGAVDGICSGWHGLEKREMKEDAEGELRKTAVACNYISSFSGPTRVKSNESKLHAFLS